MYPFVRTGTTTEKARRRASLNVPVSFLSKGRGYDFVVFQRVSNPFSISDKALCFYPQTDLKGFFLTRNLLDICNQNSSTLHLSYTYLRLLSTLITSL